MTRIDEMKHFTQRFISSKKETTTRYVKRPLTDVLRFQEKKKDKEKSILLNIYVDVVTASVRAK